MKKLILSLSLLLTVTLAWAQTKPVKILFDVTSKDTLVHQTTLRHVSGMAASYPKSSFEVVIYGGAINMVLTEKSTVANQIQKLENNKNVSFRVCEQTMKRYKIDKSELLPTVGTVPDAIMEIVVKQGEGWGYIKEVSN